MTRNMKDALLFINLLFPSEIAAFLLPNRGTFIHRRVSSSSPKSLSVLTPLSAVSSAVDETCDILVLGSGPAGLAISSLLAQKDLKVCLADATYERPIVPNYGVWQDEWESIIARYEREGISLTGGSYGKALNREWMQTDCFFGGSFGKSMTERTQIDRPYCQVDKFALKKSLSSTNVKLLKANHQSKATSVNIYSPNDSLVHDVEGTTTVLKDSDGNPLTVRSRLVVDTTGHESKLVLRDARAPANAPPGFQIAYGCLVEVDETNSRSPLTFGPYDKEAMTLFDYRTDHLKFDPSWEERAIQEPTFMYVMPIEGNQVFFEETSLVARPGISFQECKDRCFRRLEYLGIKVSKVEEEEYCYIPMGGSLPLKDQRVIALGGSAAMVHPATGYHLCRMLTGAVDVANSIAQELNLENPNLDRAAASAYHALWSPENIRQRNFAVFGGEFLMQQNVVGLRGFFDGFFKLPLELWAGFLAGWPGLPNNNKHETWYARIWFGLNFIRLLPPQVAFEMFSAIVKYSINEGAPLPQSVTPLLGAPPSYEYRDFRQENVGDLKAKSEARRMITESMVTKDLPQAFGELPLGDPSLLEPANESKGQPEVMSTIQLSEVTTTLSKIETEGPTEAMAIKPEDGGSSTLENSSTNELIYQASEVTSNDLSDSVSEFE